MCIHKFIFIIFTFFLSDCFEEEDIINALQRDSDPSLAATSTITNSSSSSSITGLESLQVSSGYIPLDSISGIVTDDGLMANSRTSFVEELFDPGVAMEASEAIPIVSSSSLSNEDYTASLCSPSTTSASFYSFTSPPLPLSSSPSPYYPSLPVPVSTTHEVSPVPDFIGDNREAEIEYLCSTFLPTTSHPPLPHNKMVSPPSPHRTDMRMMSPINTYSTHHQMQQPSAPGFFMNNDIPPQEVIPIEAINSLPLLTSDGRKWSISDYGRSDTQPSGDRRHSPSPTPSYIPPSPASSTYTDYPESEFGKESLASPDVPPSFNTVSKTELIHMPYFEFKKLLDSGSVSERDKDEVKAIRKRGKNKTAAKNCRHRKLEQLSTLQQEIDSLKGRKARLALKALALQREIEGYQRKCSPKQTVLQSATSVH